ncbi:Adaptin [Hexamita inflata]|uniref:Adaptin n=1 Tax=Hexamita inflata TaxID=28002 RepID=A0AA86TGD3_9EUKA|nr:Adaptin [Hexamita inflata]CAI9960335.1 Adaptin [Hexamita inflata]
MISACFILNPKGQPIAVREYRADLPKGFMQEFGERVIHQEDAEANFVAPVFEANGVIYAHTQHYGLHYACASVQDANAFVMIEYLNQLAKVFNSYFDKATEEAIQDNITIVYELLDETMDYGYPQTLEPDVLKAFIQQRSLLDNLIEKITAKKQQQVMAAPPAVTGLVSWRKEGIKYRKNEAYLDVVENLDLIMTQEGKVLASTVKGAFKMRSQLTGMPNLKLGLNDRVRFDAAFGNAQNFDPSNENAAKQENIDLEDVKLHQCVKLNQFEEDKTISFIPPDGAFDLLSYRITQPNRKPTIVCQVQETKNHNGFSYNIKIETNYKSKSMAREIVIQVPVPVDADTPEFRPSVGVAKYRPPMQCLEWTIKQMPGKQTATLVASFGLPTCRVMSEELTQYTKRPITVKFDIPYYSLSGINVRYLKIHDKSGYEATPWVRYLASGVITIRR